MHTYVYRKAMSKVPLAWNKTHIEGEGHRRICLASAVAAAVVPKFIIHVMNEIQLELRACGNCLGKAAV